MPRVITLAIVLLGVCVAPANAALFQPTRYDDPAPNGCVPLDCSLREAVIAAVGISGGPSPVVGTPGSDTILLAPGDVLAHARREHV